MSQDHGQGIASYVCGLRRMRSDGTTFSCWESNSAWGCVQVLLLWVWAKAAPRVAGDVGRSPRMELLDIVSESSDQFEGAVKQKHVKAGKTIRDSVSTATVLAGSRYRHLRASLDTYQERRYSISALPDVRRPLADGTGKEGRRKDKTCEDMGKADHDQQLQKSEH